MTLSEAKTWVKEFLLEVSTQDNRATRAPIQFLLQQKIEYVAHDEYGHGHTRTVFRHSNMESSSYDTKEEVINWLKEYGYEGEELEKEIENIEQHEMGHYWNTTQAFFTKKGVNEHIRMNRHNLGEHRDWVTYCFRNPEIEQLFEALKALVGE